MADDKDKQDAEKTEDASEIPVVEAEIVGEEDLSSEAAAESDAADDENDAPAADADEASNGKSIFTPGVILFGVFLVISIGAMLYWRFIASGDAEEIKLESAPEAAAIEQEEPPALEDNAPQKIVNETPDDLDAIKDVASTLPKAVTDPVTIEPEKFENTPLADAIKENLQGADGSVAAADAAVDEAIILDIDEPAPVETEAAAQAGALEEELAATAGEEEPASPPRETPTDEQSNDVREAEPPLPTIEEMQTATADSEKISNELQDLRDLILAQNQSLSGALEEERARSAALEQEIFAMRSEFSEALAARDAAHAESLSSLRTEIAEQESNDPYAPARLAAGVAALNGLLRAMEAGAPFTTQLDVLANITPGAAVDALRPMAASGVTPLGQLKEEFGVAAREGLAVAGREKTGGLLAGLKNLISVRSAVPRAGTEPGAIISRAEAAVEENDISGALNELSALPAPVLEAMSGWIDGAKARASAEAAAASLSARLLEASEEQATR